MTDRRFPAPWTVEEYRGISYIVRDANKFAVVYVYFANAPGRHAAASLMTKDEARKVAAGIAKLPELLGAAQPEGNPLVQRRPRPDATPR
jgi:hypothetical protein